MPDSVLHLLALIAATGGMAAFALVNDGHWRQLFSPRPQTAAVRTTGKATGAGLLALAFVLCVLADPVSMALLVWPMLIGAAAALVAAFLTLQAHLKRRA